MNAAAKPIIPDSPDSSPEQPINYLTEAAIMRIGVPEALALARNSIQNPLKDQVQPLFKLMTEYEESGNYALWLDTLLWIGQCAEELGLDTNLPAEFWEQIAFVCNSLMYPECLPYVQGKINQLPARYLYDSHAAAVIIHRELGSQWANIFPDMPSQFDDYISTLAATHPDYPTLFSQATSREIAERLKIDGWNVEVLPETFWTTMDAFYDSFWHLFYFVTAQGFPEHLLNEQWSILAYSSFRIKYSDSLFYGTQAKPWWMN